MVADLATTSHLRQLFTRTVRRRVVDHQRLDPRISLRADVLEAFEYVFPAVEIDDDDGNAGPRHQRNRPRERNSSREAS